MKRSRINPISKKRQRQNAERKAAMLEVFGPREGWKCQLRGKYLACFGDINGHELLKRSRGGSITDMTNVVLLCNVHNSWVEDYPELAYDLGLAKHSWEDQ
jgi:hypothetical protein